MNDTQTMRNYTVTWTVEVQATHPAEAAKIAREIQQNPGNHATTYAVSPCDTPSGRALIDLLR